MTMKKPVPNINQFGLNFGEEHTLKELKPTVTNQSPAREIDNIYSPPATLETDQENDREEDPQAQRAREWREYKPKRRA